MILSQSSELGELATALAKAQAQIQGAVKDRTNPAFKSSYADLASVWEACRVPLTSHGLSVTQHPGRLEDGSVTVTTLLLHASGQHLASMVSATPRDQSPASVGSILTYLRRYALSAVAGVAPSDDDDGQAATPPTQPQRAPQPPPSADFYRAVDRVQKAVNGTVESVERIQPTPAGMDPSCPTCSGSMWDNRPKKQSGDMNPKAPDFKCKDKSCQGVIWKHGEKPRGPVPQTRAPLLEQAHPPDDENGPGFPF